ncbi:putative ABC transporter ATP-binding protein YbhF [Rosistilla carotiformis]|uniref:Putative ABC transporter ATP-binding protein YbhF n=1 Tax=Rosistilla carotiformis TaxID=2528017 RepID=A0A518JYM9_9BACT|nr:ABC transporter ATP-binding protein [Rosistilla carotiformis]QDV70642.1 putative ABC transporter ATP-binding protein YbhF [Rosistilla carotiformis]
MSIVETRALTKRFGDFVALDRCSLTVQPGDVFGLLGPNGAGKTTLLRTLLGFLRPSSGTASICGHDVFSESLAVRQNVAYLPGDARLPRHMRGRSVLRFFSDLHPLGSAERSLALADRFELDLQRRVGFMSTGMRQKLALCVVLSTQSPIVILDEPTANLDPSVRKAVLEQVEQIRDSGRTVILSSHVLSEIEQVCNRVVFLRRGQLVLEQSISELKDRHRIILWIDDKHFEIPHSLRERVEETFREGDRIVLETDSDLAPLLSWLATLAPRELRLEPLGIEAIYDRVHHPVGDASVADSNAPQEVA